MAARPIRPAVLAFAALLLSSTCPAWADDAPGPTLRIPGFPPVPLPPGTRAFGPDARDDGEGHGPDRPDADIYHEFGTVTPGGGRARRPDGRAPGINGQGLNGQGLGQGVNGPGTSRPDINDPDASGMVVGPGGVVRPPNGSRPSPPKAAAKPQPTPQERQAQIRRALMPQQPLASVRRKTLDDLYGKLAAARDENEAKGVASLISAVWLRSGSDTANLLMARAEGAIASHNYPLALGVLDRLVALQPTWAEAWNKRASARFLAGDLDGSMADVDRVLKLEPNHFAALNGLAMILQRTGFPRRALQVYRRELAVYPHQPAIEQLVDKLSAEVEGQGI